MRRASSHTDGSRSNSPPPRLVTRHLICGCSAYNLFGFGIFRELQLLFITVLWMYEGVHWVSEPRV